MNNLKKVYLAAIVQAVLVGLSFMFTKIALEYVTPISLLAYRFFFAFIVSSLPIILKQVRVRVNLQNLIRILPLALFYPVLFLSFQTFGLLYSTSSEAGVIMATAPIFTTILSNIFLNEKTNKTQNLFIVLSMSGVIFISVMNSRDLVTFSILGTFLLFLSTLSSSFFATFSRKLSKEFPSYTITYMITIVGFIVFSILGIGENLLYHKNIGFLEPFKHFRFWIAILYSGVLSSLVSSLLTNYALSQIAASKFSVFNNLTPIVTLIAGVFILNEPISLPCFIGIIVTLIGVFGTNYFGNKEKDELIISNKKCRDL